MITQATAETKNTPHTALAPALSPTAISKTAKPQDTNATNVNTAPDQNERLIHKVADQRIALSEAD